MTTKPADRWEVKWCEKFFIDENGDHNYARDTMATRCFASEAAAIRFAKTRRPEGSGLVQIRHMTAVVAAHSESGRPLYDWDMLGNPIEIDVPWREPIHP